MSRRTLAIVASFALVAALGGIAVAVLLPQPAVVEAEAEIADPYLQFRFYHGSGWTQDQDPLPGSVIAGPGTVLGTLSGGEVSVTLSDAWAGTEARIGMGGGVNLALWLVGPSGTEIEVTGLDFSAAPGFGPPGSGEPVEVELLQFDGSPWTYPAYMSTSLTPQVEIALSINENVAENGATYGPATFTLVGEPYVP